MKIKELWDNFTNNYGHTLIHPQYLLLKELRSYEKKILKELTKKRGVTVLDVGMGNGRMALSCRDLGIKYIGLDHPEISKLYHPSVEPSFYADIENKKTLPKLRVDYIICSQVFEYLLHPERAIANINTLLKNKGKLFLSVPFLYPIHDGPHDMLRFSPSAIKALLKENGFKIKSSITYGVFLSTTMLFFNIFLFKTVQSFVSTGGVLRFTAVLLIPITLVITTILNILVLVAERLFLNPKRTTFPLIVYIEAVKVTNK